MAPPKTKPPADTAPFAKRVADIVGKARELREDLLISDAISKDPKGGELQWVDLVLAGGGLLGIAHVGFVYILEEAGIRFRGIGGTSAGAINAMLIIALRDGPDGVSWQKTLQELADAPFVTFQDNKGFFRRLLQGFIENGMQFGRMVIVRLLLHPLKVVGAVKQKGIHSGEAFLKWVKERLEENGVHNVAELEGKLSLSSIKFMARAESIRPSTEHRNGADDSIDAGREPLKPLALPVGTDIEKIPGRLALVASDVTTETKVVFPEDTDLYYSAAAIADSKRNLPAEFVRASMSVPVFFQPLTLSNIPNACSVSELWKQRNGYAGKVPGQVDLVDGGTLSNFPIDLFHVKGRPLLPTIGVQFGHDRNAPNATPNLLKLAGAMFNSSSHLSDREFIMHNPDYKQLVAVVDKSPMDVPGQPGKKYEFNWLNFNMSTKEKVELFRRGAEAALDFLNTWHKDKKKWADYKDFRSRKANNE